MTLPIVNRSSVELQVSKDDRGRRGKGGGIFTWLGPLGVCSERQAAGAKFFVRTTRSTKEAT